MYSLKRAGAILKQEIFYVYRAFWLSNEWYNVLEFPAMLTQRLFLS